MGMTARDDSEYEYSYDYSDYSYDDEDEEEEKPKAAVNNKEVADALAADVAEEVDPDEP